MVEEVDTIARYAFTTEIKKEKKATSYHQPNQTSQQNHASSYPQPTQSQC